MVPAGGQALPLCARAGDFFPVTPPNSPSSRWRAPSLIMVLSQAEKKMDKSPKGGCLTGQRLLAMRAELFFPGSEWGRRKGGHSTSGGDAHAASTSPLCLEKEVTGGGTGGMQGRMQGCVRTDVRKAADPFFQSQSSDLIPRNGANTAQLRTSGG